MGWACGTYGRQERCLQSFGGGDLKERGHLEDQGLDWRVTLQLTLKKQGRTEWN